MITLWGFFWVSSIFIPHFGFAADFVPAVCQRAQSTQSDCDLFKEPCLPFLREVDKDVKAWSTTKIEQFYLGKNVVFDETEAGKVFPVNGTVCNPADDELVNNKRGQNCGQPAGIGQDGAFFQPGRVGTLENSFIHGAYVAVLRCMTAQVLNELNSLKGFNVSSSCKPLADEIDSLTKRGTILNADLLRQAGASGLKDNLCGQKIITDNRNEKVPDLCKNLAGVGDSEASRVSKIQQATCYIASVAASVKAAYKNLAQCEIIARLDASYTPSFLISGSRFEMAVGAEMEGGLTGMVSDAAGSCISRLRISPSCVESKTIRKIEEKYRGLIRPFAKRFVSTNFPPTGACWKP